MSVPTTYSIELPESWVQFDPRTEDLAETIAARLDAETGEVVASLLGALSVNFRRLTLGSDVVLAGLYSEQIPIDGQDEPFVLTAQMMLAMSPPVGGLEKLREVVSAGMDSVGSIDLAAGEGVVVSGTTDVDAADWDAPQPAYLRRYYVALSSLSQVAVLSFMTPNVDLCEHFDELFDAIARTLAFE